MIERMKSRSPRAARALLALVAAAALAAAPDALANGRVPAAGQLVFSAGAGSTIVLRATFGFLLSRDSGATWSWICEQAVGFDGAEDPPVAIGESGVVHAGLFAGLSRGSADGCAWSTTLPEETFIDLVVRPEARRELFAISSRYAGNDDADRDAGSLTYRSHLFRSTDDGKTLERLPVTLDPSLYFQTVEVAAGDPNRVYLSALRSRITTTEGVVLTSSDGASSFTEHPVALLEGENAPYVSGVDPRDPDHLWVRTAGFGPDAPARLLESRDGGKTFSTVFSGKGALLGFALSPDGATVWVGGPSDGLHRSPTSKPAWEKVADTRVECLATRGDELWACSGSISGFLIGRSSNGGKTFDPMLQLWTIGGALQCPAGTAQKDVCEPLWPRQAAALGIVAGRDGGSSAGDGGALTEPAMGGSMEGGGCAESSRSPVGLASAAGVATLSLVLAARRRRRSR